MKSIRFIFGSVLLATTLNSLSAMAFESDKVSVSRKEYWVLYFGNSSWKNTSNTNEIESGTLGFGLGLTYGKDISHFFQSEKGFSLELDFSYRRNEIHGININTKKLSADGNDLQVFNLGLNLRYTFDLTEKLGLYTIAGPGVSFMNVTGSGVRDFELDSTIVPTMQIGAGLEYNVNEKFGFTLGYRYLTSLENIKARAEIKKGVKENLSDKYDSHMIYAGFVIRFQ